MLGRIKTSAGLLCFRGEAETGGDGANEADGIAGFGSGFIAGGDVLPADEGFGGELATRVTRFEPGAAERRPPRLGPALPP